MRGDANWTPANEIEHWAWMSFGSAFDAWLAGLSDDHPVFDECYLGQIEEFFDANPKGWAHHPEDPTVKR